MYLYLQTTCQANENYQAIDAVLIRVDIVAWNEELRYRYTKLCSEDKFLVDI